MGRMGGRNPDVSNYYWRQLFYRTIRGRKIKGALLGNHRRKGRRKTKTDNGLALLERRIFSDWNIADINLLAGFIGDNMEEMNQRKVLGISLLAFAILMLTVCLIYQIITPSVKFVNIWFSYLVGTVLLVIGLLMAFIKNSEQPPDR
jgi:hypothetical protein